METVTEPSWGFLEAFSVARLSSSVRNPCYTSQGNFHYPLVSSWSFLPPSKTETAQIQ